MRRACNYLPPGGNSVSYSQLLDSFPVDLSYCLHLLIGFNAVEVDRGERLAAMGGIGPQVVVEMDPAANACPCL